ncbi:MAG: hypothetical protein U0610_04155 [bacterium]
MRTVSLAERTSKVHVEDFGRPHVPGETLAGFLAKLPRFLAASQLLEVADRVVAARRGGRPVIVGMGAHVIKVGLSPILIDLMERGIVTALAMNGAGIVHDYEIALAGRTSEDVDASLPEGRFGVTAETGEFLNAAIVRGHARGLGLGEAVAEAMSEAELMHPAASLLLATRRLGLSATVHVAIGTDVLHIHPRADGAAIGATALRDFQRFCTAVTALDGGVYLNLGSAVVLPEVFLKAVTLARNQGHPLADITTADLDFRAHYRPLTNVVRRPTEGHGRGFHVTGHHEINVPLLAAAILERSNR